jgi:hypothetical protein
MPIAPNVPTHSLSTATDSHYTVVSRGATKGLKEQSGRGKGEIEVGREMQMRGRRRSTERKAWMWVRYGRESALKIYSIFHHCSANGTNSDEMQVGGEGGRPKERDGCG